jgi:cytochrome P450
MSTDPTDNAAGRTQDTFGIRNDLNVRAFHVHLPLRQVTRQSGRTLNMFAEIDGASAQPRRARRRAPIARGRLVMGVFSEMLEDPLNFMLRLHQRHGDIVQLRIPLVGLPIFAVRDPELTRRILLADEKTMRKHELLASTMRGIVGPGLFTLSGPAWRVIRERHTASFSRAEVDKFGPVITGAVERMFAGWPASEGEVDVVRAMSMATLQVTLEGLLGLAETSSADDIYDAFETMQEQLTQGASQVLRFFKWIPTPGNQRMRRALVVLSQVVERIVEHAASSAEPAPHIAAILAARESGQPLTDQQLFGEIINTLFSGHDTTATTLALALRMLTLHREALAEAEAETARVLAGRTPTVADVRQLETLAAVVQETLRLYPPAWAQQRTNLSDLEYEGYLFPRGSVMMVSTWALHRHPQHWPDPEAFIPGRFAKAEHAQRHPFAHVPFGAGARTCIGRHLALTESAMILAMILQRYELLSTGGTPELRARLTLRPHPVEIRVRKRERALGAA